MTELLNENDVGKYIAKARIKSGLSQRELAKISNISNSEISKIESGIRININTNILKRLCKFINLEFNELLYLMGVGNQINTLNPYLFNYYLSLENEELKQSILATVHSIKNNENIIKFLKKKLEENNNNEVKDILLDTIEDLKFQNKVNSEILEVIKNKEKRGNK